MYHSVGDPDDVLVARLRAGHEDALDALIARYYGTLTDFVERYVGSRDVAEDVVQELFVRVWNRRAGWVLQGTCRAYLYTAARNAALKYLRGESARDRAEATAGAEHEMRATAIGSADEAVDVEELRIALATAIAGLPPRCREVYTLVREHGLSYDETAAALGISASTVRTQMGRALQALERYLVPFWESL